MPISFTRLRLRALVLRRLRVGIPSAFTLGMEHLKKYILEAFVISLAVGVVISALNIKAPKSSAYAALLEQPQRSPGIVECTTDSECESLNPQIEFSLDAE